MPTEPLPIVDWLALYNLECYAEAFVTAGYDDSSYLIEIADKVNTVLQCNVDIFVMYFCI